MDRKANWVNHHASWWEQWLEQPQRLRSHNLLFQLHFWIGSIAGLYMLLMSITYLNVECSASSPGEAKGRLHHCDYAQDLPKTI
jgi:hypothetical protein